jgi:hypothetical protein
MPISRFGILKVSMPRGLRLEGWRRPLKDTLKTVAQHSATAASQNQCQQIIFNNM